MAEMSVVQRLVFEQLSVIRKYRKFCIIECVMLAHRALVNTLNIIGWLSLNQIKSCTPLKLHQRFKKTFFMSNCPFLYSLKAYLTLSPHKPNKVTFWKRMLGLFQALDYISTTDLFTLKPTFANLWLFYEQDCNWMVHKHSFKSLHSQLWGESDLIWYYWQIYKKYHESVLRSSLDYT